MADDDATPELPTEAQDAGAQDDARPQVGVIAQYVKDMSFENPNAPRSFQIAEQPQIEMNVNVGARKAGDDAYEVELKIDASARADGTATFVVELVYAGIFGLRNIPEEALEPFLLVEAPRLLFPFARRIVADAVRDGGYPPLMLEPIDFMALYLAQRQQSGEMPQVMEGSA